MRGGGKVTDDVWHAKVSTLRPGDVVYCLNWNNLWWCGGEPLVVEDVRPSGLRDGRSFVILHEERNPDAWIEKDLLNKDEVVVVSRDVREVPRPMVVMGPQLALFEED